MSWWSRVPKAYLRRRLLTVLLMWLGISALAFIVGHLAPGDPGYAILSSELERPPTPAKVAALDHTLGLDRPVLVQYYHWLVSALHGNLGHSYQTGQSVLGVLGSRLPATSVLAGAALGLAMVISIPLGTWAALRASGWPDRSTRLLAVGSAALPSFWVGYLLIIAFAVLWPVLPAQGESGGVSLILPAATLAIAIVGVPLRLVRTSALEVLGQDYVRTARALGIPETTVVLRHVLRYRVLDPRIRLGAGAERKSGA